MEIRTGVHTLDTVAASINDPARSDSEEQGAIMDDGDEWTETKLVHEIISDLEGLQGTWLEWKSVGFPGFMHEMVRLHTWEGQVFRMRLAMIGGFDSEEFDREFDE